jgi:hypothetical protein
MKMFIYDSITECAVIADQFGVEGSKLVTWRKENNIIVLDAWVAIIDSEIDNIEEAKSKYPEYFV